jgi:acetyl-CoA C-acetyltransferase
MESMTQAPHLLMGSRAGFRFGDVTMRDHMAYDGLFCSFDQLAMGVAVERFNKTLDITRAEQDEYAARSHEFATAAAKDGRFDDEIVPVAVPQRGGEPLVVTQDEGVRADTTYELLSALRPAFAPDGTITAGSSSQISDGGCALVVTSREAAERLGLQILAEIVGHGMTAGPDTSLHSKPSAAIAKALARTGLEVGDLDLVEINEAFSAVVIKSTRDLGLDPEIVNVDGGAISLGHPIGMSGARLVLHLALELRRRGGGLGAAALCGGGGQGDAILIRVPAS